MYEDDDSKDFVLVVLSITAGVLIASLMFVLVVHGKSLAHG